MEAMGTISEGGWSNFISEEADFMSQFLNNCTSIPNHEVPISTNSKYLSLSSSFWPSHEPNSNVESTMYYSSDETNTNNNMYSFSLGSSYDHNGDHSNNIITFPYLSHDQISYYPPPLPNVSHQFLMNNNNNNSNNFTSTMDYCKDNIIHVMHGDEFLNQDVSNESLASDEKLSEDVDHHLQGKDFELGKRHEKSIQEPLKEDKIPEKSRKRPRIPTGESQRSKRSNMKLKCPKVDHDDNNNTNNINSGCCSEDDSNASHELNGVTSTSSNLTGKTRASRGSATDPQSLYARKRRERINERLRILQSLVPNGTKVDISTMLEEAVQYVKFLQLQIKLLSSDDLWMYSPIAYNGMDIGLLKINSPKSQS